MNDCEMNDCEMNDYEPTSFDVFYGQARSRLDFNAVVHKIPQYGI